MYFIYLLQALHITSVIVVRPRTKVASCCHSSTLSFISQDQMTEALLV